MKNLGKIFHSEKQPKITKVSRPRSFTRLEIIRQAIAIFKTSLATEIQHEVLSLCPYCSYMHHFHICGVFYFREFQRRGKIRLSRWIDGVEFDGRGIFNFHCPTEMMDLTVYFSLFALCLFLVCLWLLGCQSIATFYFDIATFVVNRTVVDSTWMKPNGTKNGLNESQK